ncbi:MAG: hypothetical protein JSS79_10335 [Bacteroidetes bacterium]|nr:hypothetical protein [Bacteroidota bacterium]
MRSLAKIQIPEAFSSLRKKIHISEAIRGRRGYSCTGCGKDLEAVIPRHSNIQPYFRHVAKDVDAANSECTYANETYRHQLAKQFLQEDKSIRVPRVLKFPPSGVDGEPKLMMGPVTITAFSVSVEKSFYIDSLGQLRWGPKTTETSDDSDKHCLIVPDVIFFDRDGRPILFIELVATHELDEVKEAKLRALKIDTVSVRLPHDSPESIRECFKNTERTKWVYHYGRENTDYFKLPGSVSHRVSRIDDHESGISFETARCRKSRVRNLVRGVTKFLGSDGFREVTGGLERQIDEAERVLSIRRATEERIDEEASEHYRGQRETIQGKQARLDRISIQLEGRYKNVREQLGIRRVRRDSKRRRQIKGEENRLDILYSRVQERYERKGREMEAEEAELNRILRNLETHKSLTTRESERIDRELEKVERSMATERNAIEELQGKMESVPDDFNREAKQIESRIRSEKRKLEQDFNNSRKRSQGTIERLRDEEKGLSGGFEPARREIEDRYQRIRDEVVKTIEGEDASRNSELSRKIKELVSTRRVISDYATVLQSYQRYTEALRFIGSETFKTWLNSRRSVQING